MADEKKDKAEDIEEVEGDKKSKKKKPWLLIGIISVLVLVLLGGGVVAALYFTGMFEPEMSVAVDGVKPEGEAEDEEADAEDEEESEDEEDGEDGEEADGEAVKQTAIYIPIESTFVVNFEGKGKIRFLQVTVELMTRNEKMVDAITTHMPVIRNNLTLLFSGRTYEDVSTVAGKEALRADALKEVQKIMEAETEDPSVDAVYFTSFVTQ